MICYKIVILAVIFVIPNVIESRRCHPKISEVLTTTFLILPFVSQVYAQIGQQNGFTNNINNAASNTRANNAKYYLTKNGAENYDYKLRNPSNNQRLQDSHRNQNDNPQTQRLQQLGSNYVNPDYYSTSNGNQVFNPAEVNKVITKTYPQALAQTESVVPQQLAHQPNLANGFHNAAVPGFQYGDPQTRSPVQPVLIVPSVNNEVNSGQVGPHQIRHQSQTNLANEFSNAAFPGFQYRNTQSQRSGQQISIVASVNNELNSVLAVPQQISQSRQANLNLANGLSNPKKPVFDYSANQAQPNQGISIVPRVNNQLNSRPIVAGVIPQRYQQQSQSNVANAVNPEFEFQDLQNLKPTIPSVNNQRTAINSVKNRVWNRGQNEPVETQGPKNSIVQSSKDSLAISRFGLNLFRVLDNNFNNVAISPFLIVMILALIQQGAVAQTQDEITTALGLTHEESASAFFKYIDSMKRRRHTSNILYAANNVFVSSAFQLKPLFRTTASHKFNSDVTPISFSNPLRAAFIVNQWITRQTNNRIADIINAESLDPSANMLLANSIYFRGLWQSMFSRESTADLPFYLNNGQIKSTSFMRSTNKFRYGYDPDINSYYLSLPFENEEYYMTLVLPEQGYQLGNVIHRIDENRVAAFHSSDLREVSVEIPKFSVRTYTSLNYPLQRMGIQNIFLATSNLQGIGSYSGVSPQVSLALHTAELFIDEDGGTGSAASAFSAVALSYDEPVNFLANRPFLAILWDRELLLPLYMVRVEDPTL